MYVLSELIWDVCGVLQNFSSKEDIIFCGVFVVVWVFFRMVLLTSTTALMGIAEIWL